MLHRRVFPTLAVVAPTVVAARPAACQAQRDSRIAKLKALVDAYVSLEQLSGVVLVAERGRILLRRGVGYSDREMNVAAKPEHRFVIGSITKGFTAVLT